HYFTKFYDIYLAPVSLHEIIFHYHTVGSKTLWPEFEITIEDESEYNRDISEENTLDNSLISRNRTDDTMNSVLDNFKGDDDKKSWASFQERIANAPEQVLR
ncbi:uncharacterized protein LOC114915703, partial [Cajanus cajan]